MNNKILEKVDDLVEFIKNSSDYKKYQKLKLQVKNNKEIMKLIEDVKSLQKQAVKKEYNKEDASYINGEINNKIKKLEEYPIYQEMTYLEEDLNSLFISIKEKLDNYISNQVN